MRSARCVKSFGADQALTGLRPSMDPAGHRSGRRSSGRPVVAVLPARRAARLDPLDVLGDRIRRCDHSLYHLTTLRPAEVHESGTRRGRVDHGRRLPRSSAAAARRAHLLVPRRPGVVPQPALPRAVDSRHPASCRGRVWLVHRRPVPATSAVRLRRQHLRSRLPLIVVVRDLPRASSALGQLAPGVGVDEVGGGDEVELIVGTLFSDDEHDYQIWRWQPRGGEHATSRRPQGRCAGATTGAARSARPR